MTQFHHGITAIETLTGTLPMRTVSTAIIALIAHADDADTSAFPLGQPVLVTSIPAVLSKAGVQGTLRRSLETIAPITRPTLVVVRCAAPTGDSETPWDVSGITAAIDSLLACPSTLGITPKILIAPELETPDVVQAMISYCQRRRAYCYVTPRDVNGVMLPTMQDVTTYRATLSARECELIWPEFTGGNVLQPASGAE